MEAIVDAAVLLVDPYKTASQRPRQSLIPKPYNEGSQ